MRFAKSPTLSAHPGERRDPDQRTPSRKGWLSTIWVPAFAGMSGCKLPTRILALLAPLVLMTACATDGLYTGGDAGGSHFTQIGRAPVAPPPTRATTVAEAIPGPSIEEVRRRVEAYLSQAGFEPASVAAAGRYTISGDRMASAKGGEQPKAEAVCALKALERPQMYTTHVDVRLTPASAAGVQMGIEVKVVELDANLLSGAFSKQTCQSRGVLEAALRRAAFGG